MNVMLLRKLVLSREIEKGLTQIPRPASYTNYFSFLLHLACFYKGKGVVSTWIFPSEFCYSFHVRLICWELDFFNLFLPKRAFKKVSVLLGKETAL